MTRIRTTLALLLFAALVSADDAPKKPRTDVLGDPLPADAVSRMGTVRWKHGDVVTFVGFLADGKTLVSAANDKTVRLWDVANGQEKRCITHTEVPQDGRRFTSSPRYQFLAAMSADGKRLATGGMNAGVRVWDLETGKEVQKLPVGQLYSLALSPDGKTLATGDGGSVVRVWSVADGKEVSKVGADPVGGRVTSGSNNFLRFSPDGKSLATTAMEPIEVGGGGRSYQRILRIHDVADGKERCRIGGTDPMRGSTIVYGVAFSPDSKRIASIDSRSGIRITDAAAGKLVREITTRAGRFTGVAFSPDGKTVYARSMTSGGIGAWEVETGKELLKPEGAAGGFSSRTRLGTADLTVSPDGKSLAVAGEGNAARLIDAKTGKDASALSGHRAAVQSIRFEAGQIVTTAADQTERTWELASGKEKGKRDLPSLPTYYFPPTVSPDGKTRIAGDPEGTARLEDVATGKLKHKLNLQVTDYPYSIIAFSGDSRFVALRAPYENHSIHVFSVETGKAVVKLDTPAGNPQGGVVDASFLRSNVMAFSPDGSRLAAPGVDGTVFLFEVQSGAELRRIAMPPNGQLRDAMFSPDGRVLALDAADGAVALWEVATGKERIVLGERRKEDPRAPRTIVYGTTPRATPENLRFSADGRRVVLVGDGPKVRVWDLLGSKEGVLFEGHLGETTAAAFSPDGKVLVTGSGDGTAIAWDLAKLKQAELRELKGGELESAWNDLAGVDGAKAFDAIRALAGSPKSAVELFKERLKTATPVEDAQIVKLIVELDDRRFATRQKAQEELEKLGPLATSALKKALDGNLAIGVKKTIQELIDKAGGVSLSGSQLQTIRAVEALERAATPEARELLQTLAKGPDGDPLTMQARMVLERIGK